MKRITLLILAMLFSLSGQAQLINLPQTPMAVTNPVPPNVVFMVDDSRTMNFEVMAMPLWDACAYDPNVTGTYSNQTTCGGINYSQGQFFSYNGSSQALIGFIYNNADNITSFTAACGPGGNLTNCPQAATADWRILSADANVNFYNPSITYQPWKGPCNLLSLGSCPSASFTAALSYPVVGTAGLLLSRNLSGAKYAVWIDDRGFSGNRPLRGTALNITNTGNGKVDLWDSHVDIVLNSTNAQVYTVTYNPTAMGMEPTTTLQATLTNTSACYNVLGSADLVKKIFNGSLGYTSTGEPGCMTLAQAQQNYADYYQYARRRSMAVDGSVNAILDAFPDFRYGYGNAHQTNPLWLSVQPFPFTSSTLNQNIAVLTALYNTGYNNATKVRFGLDSVGRYFSRNLPSVSDNPIACATQKNYAVLLTDGFWNDSFNSGSYGDADQDGFAITIADVARYYYQTNLQPAFTPNQVSPTPENPATWLHMSTLIGSFGPIGYLTPGDDGWPTPSLQTNSVWGGNPATDPIAQIDDLWHAAYNSAGAFFKLQDPSKVVEAIKNVINVPGVQLNSGGQGVGQSSTVLNTSAHIYQGVFNANSWTGDLLDYSISLTGVLSTTPNWSANCKLTGGACSFPEGTHVAPAPASRVIITRNWNGSNTGIPFRFPANYTSLQSGGNYPTNLANFLALAPNKVTTNNSTQIAQNQAYGEALLNYLRGQRANEVQNQGSYKFRNRRGLLGDIVNSIPVFVGPPARVFADSVEANAYSTFKKTYADRIPVVYVGANDGMLHGFNAHTGEEVLAYVPGVRQVYQNLPNLSVPLYGHNFFVDGSAVEGDVYFNNAWHTILVGGLRNGGQGIYALNITDPANFTEANASNIYLWEFTDQDDPDVGYVHGFVSLTKVRTGAGKSEWAVVFGNGYNNSQADGFASTTGKATLFVLLIDRFNGTWTRNSNYYKFTVGSGTTTKPDGLAAPFVAALNPNYIADYVYAGDLAGNMHKFDLTSDSPSSWTSSTLFTASFSSAGDQPITAQPIVGSHPNGLQFGVMVYFGTGRFLQATDNSGTGQTTQSFYAIWDKLNNTTVTKNKLVQQQILGEVTTSTGTYRGLSSNAINWNAGTTQNLGWYMNLIVNGVSSNLGERVVFPPLLRNGNVIFTTILPHSDPCMAGGTSFLMEVNAASGGNPTLVPFDITADGLFTSADYITLTVNGTSITVNPAGIKSTVGFLGIPSILVAPDRSFETKVLSGTSGMTTIKENTPGLIGRQNWRQIY